VAPTMYEKGFGHALYRLDGRDPHGWPQQDKGGQGHQAPNYCASEQALAISLLIRFSGMQELDGDKQEGSGEQPNGRRLRKQGETSNNAGEDDVLPIAAPVQPGQEADQSKIEGGCEQRARKHKPRQSHQEGHPGHKQRD